MTKNRWKKRLVEYCKAVGTYRNEFETKIDLAAQILEDRDEALEEFETNGRKRTTTQTNKNGSKNEVKDPKYAVWKEACRDASAVLSDLGLDPKSLKKIDEDAMKPQKKNALSEALKDLG